MCIAFDTRSFDMYRERWGGDEYIDTSVYIHMLYVRICVRVCVCEREREREKEMHETLRKGNIYCVFIFVRFLHFYIFTFLHL